MAQVQALIDALSFDSLIDGNDIARVSGSTPRSVSRWQARKAIPKRDVEERLLELKSVLDLLREVLTDEPARLWLKTPNPDLGYRKPIDVISEGGYREVIAGILAMAEGVTA
ncbi:MAG: DUF2384 domain-containing protein [Actinobacteria bacterium]|nr:DUF2384 domain-containing protein [Actinomycetota bacterium]